MLSGGRFDFGVGIGWLAEEFAAVGVPWERRTNRTREYLKAMKLLWTEEELEFNGEFCIFSKSSLTRSRCKSRTRPLCLAAKARRHSGGWVREATAGSA
jgi:alkanesulfonate monooxygenase SsuD/methylene tetrahydromethanopterin reductase-like flavin-dependent oxidoreductase (luciferase family)